MKHTLITLILILSFSKLYAYEICSDDSIFSSEMIMYYDSYYDRTDELMSCIDSIVSEDPEHFFFYAYNSAYNKNITLIKFSDEDIIHYPQVEQLLKKTKYRMAIGKKLFPVLLDYDFILPTVTSINEIGVYGNINRIVFVPKLKDIYDLITPQKPIGYTIDEEWTESND